MSLSTSDQNRPRAWWSGLDGTARLVITGLTVLTLVLLIGFVVKTADGRAARNGSVTSPTSSSPARVSTSPTRMAVRSGFPPELKEPTTQERARKYSDWLIKFGGTDFDAGSLTGAPDDLARFARHYGTARGGVVALIPGHGTQTRYAIRTAAKKVRAGEKALQRRQYSEARDAFDEATQALKRTRDLLRSDLRTIERKTGRRVTRGGFVTQGIKTSPATINYWVDGDTVDTDQGRVRLIGVNTPELTEECEPAQAAKAAAEQLAPAGQKVRLVNPESVQNTDRYGRLLRYVDVDPASNAGTNDRVDVGFSLLLSGLAEPRYDSRDGYQWHPRESAYRATDAQPAAGTPCHRTDDQDAFATVSLLALTHGNPEYWRKRIIVDLISHPYSSASRHLRKHVASVRRANVHAERLAQQRRDRARREREREQKQSSGPPSDSTPPSSSYPGYTGPRCYAPGGKSWRPC